MGIVKLKPDSTLYNDNTTLLEVLQKPNESVFTNLYPETKINSLLKYVEGYPWTVNYYGHLVNTANTLEHVDPNIPNFIQPCYEVKGAILQVSSALSASYDESTAITTVTGSALVPYKMTPNTGDFFLAQVDSGEDAVFVVTSVSRKTHRKDTLYEIGYSLYLYTSTDPTFMENVVKRVQDTYYFNKDTNFFNRDLLVTPAVKDATDKLKVFLYESREYYFSRFLKKEVGIILIPGTEGRYYDPYLSKFIAKTVPHDFFIGRGISGINIFDKYIEQDTFFDAILGRSTALLRTINKTISFVSSTNLRNKSRFGTAFHAGIDYIAYPTTPDMSDEVDAIMNQSPVDLFNTGFITLKNYAEYTKVVETTSNDTVSVKPLLHSLFVGDYYIVSESFYLYEQDNTVFNSVSFIELLILRFLRREAISRTDLLLAVSTYREWSLVHQMYLLPVLWVIISSLGI